MGSTQGFWDLLREGGPGRPVEARSAAWYEARAEAKSFATALRLGKMTLPEVCATIRVSAHEAAALSAFISMHPEEGVIVESAIEFRSAVATQLDKILRGGWIFLTLITG